MFRLNVLPYEGEPFEYLCVKDALIVGGSPTAELSLKDPGLLRQHARLFRNGGSLLVESLGAASTLLNGEPVTKITSLKVGDNLSLAQSTISILEIGSFGLISANNQGTEHTQAIFRSISDLLPSPSYKKIEVKAPDGVQHYIDRLELLNEIHQALGRSISLPQLLELILDRAFELLNPQEAIIFLKSAQGDFERAASRSVSGLVIEFPTSRSLLKEVTEKLVGALVFDAKSDDRFVSAESIRQAGIRSLVAAPLLDQGEALGIIVLSSRVQTRQFSEEDLALLASLASVAALRMRNIALAEAAAEKRRLQEEVMLARVIQEALLPERIPEAAGFTFYGRTRPSRGVSGDYFQVVERSTGAERVLMVADVSGKGIAASLLTASLEALSSVVIEEGYSPAEILRRVSRMLQLRMPPNKFVTAFIAVLQPSISTLRYCNAGHNPPIVVRVTGEIKALPATGLPLGLPVAGAFIEEEVILDPGDTLIVYTDGITEAENQESEEYSLERLSSLCKQNRNLDLESLARAIEIDVESFVRGRPFADDRTLVMVRRLFE